MSKLIYLTGAPATGKSTLTENLKKRLPALQDEITFTEYPLDTPISDQYANMGIIFGGDSPFIAGYAT